MSALVVTSAGPQSTLQDRGRIGYQRFGVSPAGALDPLYLAAANALAGNPADAAAVEFTLAGDTYAVEADSVRIAVAGDFAVAINGRPAASWRSHRLLRGQTLAVGPAARGARGYLAAEGGFAVAPVLGSVSTHLRTRIGGLDGGALKAGDALPLALAQARDRPDRRLDPGALPARSHTIRVVPGPQDDHFSDAGRATFFAGEYAVTAEADRMGIRLSGPQVEHARGYNIVSDGIVTGAIQVPGSGLPIVLLVDRQTAGGYPKIAVAIAPDIAAMAQLRPGDRLRFRAVGADEARREHRAFREAIAGLPGLLRPIVDPAALDSGALLALNLIGGVVDGTAPEPDGEP